MSIVYAISNTKKASTKQFLIPVNCICNMELSILGAITVLLSINCLCNLEPFSNRAIGISSSINCLCNIELATGLPPNHW